MNQRHSANLKALRGATEDTSLRLSLDYVESVIERLAAPQPNWRDIAMDLRMAANFATKGTTGGDMCVDMVSVREVSRHKFYGFSNRPEECITCHRGPEAVFHQAVPDGV